ncbi:MAG: CHASE2 domain-containing protein [Gammaproteobacteria bacterium]|nr:CHASE2 domain-containing protein [Gammaproteobacteria bacterium]MCF6229805.1 CHASE2 domain-containing protein [Gammaproteobacteria bacterium]
MNKPLTSKYSGIRGTLLVLAITLLTTMSALTTQSGGWLYDLFNRLSPLTNEQGSSVVLVTASPEQLYADDALWQVAVERLFSAGAKGVVFGFQPKGLSGDYFSELFSSGGVILARQLARDPISDQLSTLEPLPSSVDNGEITWGVVYIADDSDGIYRSHKSSQTRYTTLEQLAAITFASTRYSSQNPPGDYLINFLAGRDALPRVTIERVVERGVIPELVSGKVVLIGLHDAYQQVGLPTPIGSGRDSLSLLEYQGFAVDTLLNARPIHLAPIWLVLLLLWGAALLSLVLLQWVGVMVATRIMALMLVLHLISATVALGVFLLWIPLAELLFLQIVIYVLLLRSQAVNQTVQIYKMIANRSSANAVAGVATSFYAIEEHWSRVITLVNQLLDLDRVIFLERVQGDHRVREVKALNCSVNDIDEMRRDYLRTPYSTAIEQRSVLLLQRNFLANEQEGEVQYLSPLIFAGEVLGFWAFSINQQKVGLIADFERRIDEFSLQIAELLYHRQQWQQQMADEQRILSKYLRLEGGDQVSRALSQMLALMDKRLRSFEDVFAGMGTAAVLYDLFGTVLQINAEMSRLVQGMALAAYDMTALDMMVSLTGVDLVEGRRYLRTVIVDQQKVTLAVTLGDVDKRAYMLSMRPLFHQSKVDYVSDEVLPFETVGVLFELISTPTLQHSS